MRLDRMRDPNARGREPIETSDRRCLVAGREAIRDAITENSFATIPACLLIVARSYRLKGNAQQAQRHKVRTPSEIQVMRYVRPRWLPCMFKRPI